MQLYYTRQLQVKKYDAFCYSLFTTSQCLNFNLPLMKINRHVRRFGINKVRLALKTFYIIHNYLIKQQVPTVLISFYNLQRVLRNIHDRNNLFEQQLNMDMKLSTAINFAIINKIFDFNNYNFVSQDTINMRYFGDKDLLNILIYLFVEQNNEYIFY